MVSVRRRRANKNPNSKVSRRSRVVKKAVIVEPTLENHWNRSRTLEQNFNTVGLVNHVNDDIGKRTTSVKLQDWNWKRRELVKNGQLDGFDSDEEIFKELGSIFQHQPTETKEAALEFEKKAMEMAARIVKQEKVLTEHERDYIQKLVNKWGDDYDRMFMDIKLNVRQLTANQLEKMAQKL
jgi:nucleolar protein 16